MEVGCTDSVNVTRKFWPRPVDIDRGLFGDDSAAIELQATNGTSLSFPIY